VKDMVAVTTLRDVAGADVTREALGERGIEVEIRRVGSDPYFGSATAEAFEVRVPADRVHEAQGVLDALEAELEEAVLRAAGVPPSDDDPPGSTDLPPPELRPRKPSWAVALALLSPLPGTGCLYARNYPLGWTLFGMSLAFFAGAIATNTIDWIGVGLGLKLVDAVLAPFAARRFNAHLLQRTHETHAADA
jgi:hypothetical protein